MGRYKYYTNGVNKVVAVSSYAGKAVRGVAKCDPHDTFDYDKGVKIAKARCDLKIAEKRRARAVQKKLEASDAVNVAIMRGNKMLKYLADANVAVQNAQHELDMIMNF